MIKFISTLCLLFCIVPTSLQAQHTGSELADYNYALDLYADGSYTAATKELLRVYYYDREGVYTQLPLQISQSFDQMGDLKQALKYCSTYLRQNNLSPENEAEGEYHKLRLLIKNKEAQNALALLYQMDNALIALDKDKYNFYSAMTVLLTEDLEEAKTYISSLSYFPKINQSKLVSTYKELEKNFKKNHKVAQLLSALVPGLGQTVNGNAADGLNSFALNGSMVWLFFEVAKNLTYLDAAISVVPWFVRFYKGGIANAGQQSQIKQKADKEALLNKLIQLIQYGQK